jgi:hypothetical protein
MVRLVLLDETDQVGGVRHIAVVHEKVGVCIVRIDVELVDTVGVERRGPPFDAVHGIALLEQQARQIRLVLPSDARDQCRLACQASPSEVRREADYRKAFRGWHCRLCHTCGLSERIW